MTPSTVMRTGVVFTMAILAAPVGAQDVAPATLQSVTLVVGGLPIIVDDQLIGSIGVGGASGDEPCALEALAKILGQPPVSASGTAVSSPGPAR